MFCRMGLGELSEIETGADMERLYCLVHVCDQEEKLVRAKRRRTSETSKCTDLAGTCLDFNSVVF
jgi:hypothetical protein